MPERQAPRAVAGVVLVGLALLAGACASGAPPARLDAGAPLPPGTGEYRVLLPPPAAGDGPFPVVYFLHDYFGDAEVLWEEGVAQELSAEMAAGRLPPFVLVAPEGRRDFWSDSWDGRRRYEEWLADGLPALVEQRLPVRAGREARGVVGISMGGFGALKLALRQPEQYAAVASLSGMLVPMEWDFVADASFFLARSLKRTFGPSPERNVLARNDFRPLLTELGTVPEEGRPALLLRAGEEDEYRLDDAARKVAALASEHGVDPDLVIEPGGHDWRYWRCVTADTIDWVVRELAGPPTEGP